MAREQYEAQVRLLIRLLPSVARENVFALKGGTAINLFIRDMTRLSVDIDLTYLPIEDRETSLRRIDEALYRIAEHASGKLRGVAVKRIAGGGRGDTRLLARRGSAEVKLEVSPVTRGVVFPPSLMAVTERVQEAFGFAEAFVVSFGDLYGGKIHAALDRQHPRDLFDIKLLIENEGLTDELFRAFLIYIASSSRPPHELLAPNQRDLTEAYEKEFAGMTAETVTLEALVQARTQLVDLIHVRMNEPARQFLLSVQACAPDWDAIALPDASKLPAIRWKLQNLMKLRDENPEKYRQQSDALAGILG